MLKAVNILRKKFIVMENLPSLPSFVNSFKLGIKRAQSGAQKPLAIQIGNRVSE